MDRYHTDNGTDIQTVSSPFLFLALDLPITPLFTDMNEKKIIPQVPLSQILAKFDGKTTQVSLANTKCAQETNFLGPGVRAYS